MLDRKLRASHQELAKERQKNPDSGQQNIKRPNIIAQLHQDIQQTEKNLFDRLSRVADNIQNLRLVHEQHVTAKIDLDERIAREQHNTLEQSPAPQGARRDEIAQGRGQTNLPEDQVQSVFTQDQQPDQHNSRSREHLQAQSEHDRVSAQGQKHRDIRTSSVTQQTKILTQGGRERLEQSKTPRRNRDQIAQEFQQKSNQAQVLAARQRSLIHDQSRSQQQLQTLAKRKDKLTRERRQMEKQTHTLTKRQETLTQKRHQVERLIKELKPQLKELSRALKQALQQTKTFAQEEKGLTQEQHQNGQKTNTLTQCQQSVSIERQRAQQQTKSLTQQQDVLKQKRRQVQGEVKAIAQRYRAVTAEVNRVQRQLNVLSKQQKTLTREHRRAQNQIKAFARDPEVSLQEQQRATKKHESIAKQRQSLNKEQNRVQELKARLIRQQKGIQQQHRQVQRQVKVLTQQQKVLAQKKRQVQQHIKASAQRQKELTQKKQRLWQQTKVLNRRQKVLTHEKGQLQNHIRDCTDKKKVLTQQQEQAQQQKHTLNQQLSELRQEQIKTKRRDKEMIAEHMTLTQEQQRLEQHLKDLAKKERDLTNLSRQYQREQQIESGLLLRFEFAQKLKEIIEAIQRPQYQNFGPMVNGLLKAMTVPGRGEIGHVEEHSAQGLAQRDRMGKRLDESEHGLSRKVLEALTRDPISQLSDYQETHYRNDMTIRVERPTAVHKTESGRGHDDLEIERTKNEADKPRAKRLAHSDQPLDYGKDIRTSSRTNFDQAVDYTRSLATEEARNRQQFGQEGNLFSLFKGLEAGKRLKASSYKVKDVHIEESKNVHRRQMLNTGRELSKEEREYFRRVQDVLKQKRESPLETAMLSFVRDNQKNLSIFIDETGLQTADLKSSSKLQLGTKGHLSELSHRKGLNKALHRNLGLDLSHSRNIAQALVREQLRLDQLYTKKKSMPPGLNLGQRLSMREKILTQAQVVSEIQMVHTGIKQLFSNFLKGATRERTRQAIGERSLVKDAEKIGRIRRSKEAMAFQERMTELELNLEQAMDRLLEEKT
ncbi:MAG: hypothetical protein MRJ96_06945 [Nitrospirales bacterium]|nr:hypothetical protein [Nitrospirales bacterium]